MLVFSATGGHGHTQAESGALAFERGQIDFAPVGARHTAGNGKTESGALGAGGEKGFEEAILLVGGSKSGVSEKRFYKSLIERADARYAAHLKGRKARSKER